MGCLPVGGSWARSVRVGAGRADGVGGGCPVWGCPAVAAVRSGVWVWTSGGAAVLALHLGRRAGQWIAGNSGGGRLLVGWSGVGGSTLRAVRLPGVLSLGALGGSLGASASRGCNRSSGARGAALRGCQGLTVGAAQPSTDCLQLARGRECVCSAFKRLLDAFCGCGGVLVRVDAVNGLEVKYGACTRECGRGCFWA